MYLQAQHELFMSSQFGGAYHVRDKRFVPIIENTTPYTVITHKDAGI